MSPLVGLSPSAVSVEETTGAPGFSAQWYSTGTLLHSVLSNECVTKKEQCGGSELNHSDPSPTLRFC